MSTIKISLRRFVQVRVSRAHPLGYSGTRVVVPRSDGQRTRTEITRQDSNAEQPPIILSELVVPLGLPIGQHDYVGEKHAFPSHVQATRTIKKEEGANISLIRFQSQGQTLRYPTRSYLLVSTKLSTRSRKWYQYCWPYLLRVQGYIYEYRRPNSLGVRKSKYKKSIGQRVKRAARSCS